MINAFKSSRWQPIKSNPRRSRPVRVFTSVVTTGIVLGATACGQPDNPQIAMCHSTVEKAVGKVEWLETNVRETNIEQVVTANYKIDGETGTIDCVYGWQRINSDEGKWATAPTSVAVNGQKMSFRDLTAASFGASREALQNVASETAKETKRVAGEVNEQATELANQAGDKGRELANQAEQKGRELAGQAGELAAEAGEKLAPAAQRAGEVATDVANEAAKKLQEVLNKN